MEAPAQITAAVEPMSPSSARESWPLEHQVDDNVVRVQLVDHAGGEQDQDFL
jgi:hypothetical protein